MLIRKGRQTKVFFLLVRRRRSALSSAALLQLRALRFGLLQDWVCLTRVAADIVSFR
jgi:hypothetical protein